jgi:hypothetical protein
MPAPEEVFLEADMFFGTLEIGPEIATKASARVIWVWMALLLLRRERDVRAERQAG